MIGFVCLVVGNLGLIFTNRSQGHSVLESLRIPNAALWWVAGGAIGFLSLVLAIPGLRDLFKFAPLHRWEVALIAFVSLISILISEGTKTKTIQKVITENEKGE